MKNILFYILIIHSLFFLAELDISIESLLVANLTFKNYVSQLIHFHNNHHLSLQNDSTCLPTQLNEVYLQKCLDLKTNVWPWWIAYMKQLLSRNNTSLLVVSQVICHSTYLKPVFFKLEASLTLLLSKSSFAQYCFFGELFRWNNS